MLNIAEANKTIQMIHNKDGVTLPVAPSQDVSELESELSALRERVADLQSDKMLMEEELRDTIAERDNAEGDKSAQVRSLVRVVPDILGGWAVTLRGINLLR